MKKQYMFHKAGNTWIKFRLVQQGQATFQSIDEQSGCTVVNLPTGFCTTTLSDFCNSTIASSAD